MNEFWISSKPAVFNETIDPAIAAVMLIGSEDVQRPLRRAWVAELARRMSAGLWSEPTDQEPLMFDVNGRCIEGQHRLHAVVQAGVTQNFQLKVGCSLTAIRTIGEGKTRNPADKISVRLGSRVSALSVAIATRMLHPAGATAFSNLEDREEFFLKHRETIVAVEALNTSRKGRRLPSPVLAVIGRAWYTKPKSKLREFVEILLTGEYDRGVSGHLGVFRFREWLDKNSAEGTEARNDMYWHTVSALDAFLRGHNRTQVVACTEERFLLPGEKIPFVRTSKKGAARKGQEANE